MDRFVTHASFTLERSYPTPPARVFAAWADPALKSRWFTGDACPNHQLDFRVGGREVATGGPEGGPVMTFESHYREIVVPERIVYTSTMSAGADVITVSLTTVEFKAATGGTQLVLTEQGAFLDGREEPAWRENGTADQLKALAAVLENAVLENAVLENAVLENTVLENTVLENTVLENTVLENSVLENAVLENTVLESDG